MDVTPVTEYEVESLHATKGILTLGETERILNMSVGKDVAALDAFLAEIAKRHWY
jgi:hypothetical protein